MKFLVDAGAGIIINRGRFPVIFDFRPLYIVFGVEVSEVVSHSQSLVMPPSKGSIKALLDDVFGEYLGCVYVKITFVLAGEQGTGKMSGSMFGSNGADRTRSHRLIPLARAPLNPSVPSLSASTQVISCSDRHSLLGNLFLSPPLLVMSKLSNLTDSLLPQPPSFSKKKYYEILDLLGTGSFGKVMVRGYVFGIPLVHLTTANPSSPPFA